MTKARVALVTGSARGMGRAMCEVLAESRHRVVGLDRREQQRGPLERTLSAAFLGTSVPRRVVEDILATEGRLDILVHHAALRADTSTARGHAGGLRPPDRRQPACRLFLSQAAAEGMRPNGWGRIIGISTVGARTGGVSILAQSIRKPPLMSVTSPVM